MSTIMVLDESRVLLWAVEHLCPPGTTILAFSCFTAAMQALHGSPPDAAVASITPAHLPWRVFQHLCAQCDPPVPVLYVSCLLSNAREAGLEPVEGDAFFLRKPFSKADLEAALNRLLVPSKVQIGESPWVKAPNAG